MSYLFKNDSLPKLLVYDGYNKHAKYLIPLKHAEKFNSNSLHVAYKLYIIMTFIACALFGRSMKINAFASSSLATSLPPFL
jgi:hypothetical protein